MAIKITLSFKESNEHDKVLYDFLESKSEIIGKSAYIKSILKEKMDLEKEEKNN
jgi:hypothetical protein